ncbi:hypothetical protein [Streptomyces albireticuli]|uniref:hypothetical protein n=1 Tax=Streptomyces albireticuli TaxID=1940 RepID=UPI003687D3E0
MNETSQLAACLARLTWSPERLARELNRKCGAGTISSKAPYNWLKGARPRRRLPQLVADVLSEHLGERVTVQELWPGHGAKPATCPTAASPATHPAPGPPATADPVLASVDWLIAGDPKPPERLRGVEVPGMAVEMLAARIQQLRGLDENADSRLVMEWALQDLQWVRKLTTGYAYDAATGVRLHRIAAELGQLAGWLAADLGLEARSRTCFLDALEAARTAGDRSLAAYIISCMSYRSAWVGRGEEALRLIRIARTGAAHEATGLEQALLATRQARAHASLGEVKDCEKTLVEAAELTVAAPPADAAWAYWLSPAVMVADAGRAWLEIGQPKRAEWHLARGIELLGDGQPRNRLLHWTSLSEARLARLEVDGAAEAAAEALNLAERVTSLRANLRLAALRRQFRQYDTAVARQIVQRSEELLGRGGPLRAVC